MPRLRITFNRVARRTRDASATKFTSRVLEGLPVSGGWLSRGRGLVASKAFFAHTGSAFINCRYKPRPCSPPRAGHYFMRPDSGIAPMKAEICGFLR